ncbi:hypothetical protein [Xanthobacter sp. 91]|uniref:hypothetical protein n=1 Tax=Xanthobacter sp. 91 TaxID=1117244 RepID=UPI0004978DF2|nr:hypothetical protein [Xanthobacter sp. 91]
MDATQILVALLVIGAPLALFLSLRGSGKGSGGDEKAAAAKPDAAPNRAKPPADYGLGREDSPSPAASAASSEPDTANAQRAAAAAAAGGALIIAAGYAAHHHSGEAGGESPHVGHSGGGPDSGDSGGSGDGDGGGE